MMNICLKWWSWLVGVVSVAPVFSTRVLTLDWLLSLSLLSQDKNDPNLTFISSSILSRWVAVAAGAAGEGGGGRKAGEITGDRRETAGPVITQTDPEHFTARPATLLRTIILFINLSLSQKTRSRFCGRTVWTTSENLLSVKTRVFF